MVIRVHELTSGYDEAAGAAYASGAAMNLWRICLQAVWVRFIFYPFSLLVLNAASRGLRTLGCSMPCPCLILPLVSLILCHVISAVACVTVRNTSSFSLFGKP